MVRLLTKIEVGDETPWGLADSVQEVVDGIYHIDTPSHGGVYIDDNHAAQIPAHMVASSHLQSSQWFEEDCDWCIPYLVFEDEILGGHNENAKSRIAKGVHKDSCNRCHAKG